MPRGPGLAPEFRGRPEVPLASSEVSVQRLSASQWRMCDTRWPEHDARSLLGFIELTGGRFEVVQVDRGFECFSFASLAEATAHFSRSLKRSA